MPDFTFHPFIVFSFSFQGPPRLSELSFATFTTVVVEGAPSARILCLNSSKIILGFLRNHVHQGFPGGSDSKEPTCNAGDWVQSLGQEEPLEKGMATHSTILAWEIPWTEEPGGLQSIESQRVKHSWATNTSHFHIHRGHKLEEVSEIKIQGNNFISTKRIHIKCCYYES